MIKDLSQRLASISSKNIEISIKEIKNYINMRRESLEILEKTRNPNLGELKVDVRVLATNFDVLISPILKNQNLNEEEISHLRFQWVCEDVAYDYEMFKEILKAKQEQEGIN